MFFGQDRKQIRRFFAETWEKYRAQLPLEPLEKIIVDIILQHPEYHSLLQDKDTQENDYPPEFGESNPFLHMGMHIAIQEQLTTNRPAGIVAVYKVLLTKLNDPHAVEHHMLECLGEALWRSQRSTTAPDEQVYLESLRSLAGRI